MPTHPDPLISSSRGYRLRGLLLFTLACFGAAAIGSLFTQPRIDGWYQQLAKPSWTPPQAVFGPVWTALYWTMALSAWLVWRRKGWWGAQRAFLLFGVQLGLNVLWSILFFGLRSPLAGLVDIALLWIAIGATVAAFSRHHLGAALLLLPYWIWVSYAAALNYAVWRMNG